MAAIHVLYDSDFFNIEGGWVYCFSSAMSSTLYVWNLHVHIHVPFPHTVHHV